MSTSRDDSLAVTKFAVGQPVPRLEDRTLVQGGGRYTDDVNLDGQVCAAFVKSQVAHGTINGIDVAAARAMPGVLAVYAAADLATAGIAGIPCRLPLKSQDGSGIKVTDRPALAADTVRFVGDPSVCVIAETAVQAQDAAEAVVVDIEPLDAVVDPRDAVAPGAPQLYADAPGNVSLDYLYGDKAKVAEAFGRAAHVTKMRLQNVRLVVNAMEPRSVVAAFDTASGRFTLYAPTQGVLGSKATAAAIMKVAPEKMRFIAVNVGGSFGMKGGIFP